MTQARLRAFSSSSSFNSKYWFVHCVEVPAAPPPVQNPRDPRDSHRSRLRRVEPRQRDERLGGVDDRLVPRGALASAVEAGADAHAAIRPGALMGASMAVLDPASLFCWTPMSSVQISLVLFAADVLWWGWESR